MTEVEGHRPHRPPKAGYDEPAHNDSPGCFHHAQRSEEYMGIHLTLMGIRGLLMPMVGVWLLKQPAIGLNVILIAMAMNLLAAAGFFLIRSPVVPRTDAREVPIA